MDNSTENLGFKVTLNGEHVCRAGLNTELFVISCILDSVSRAPNDHPEHIPEELRINIGGLNSGTHEHLLWNEQNLALNDLIEIEIIPAPFDPYEVTNVYIPPEPSALSPEGIEAKQKQLNELAEELKEYLDENGEFRD